MDKWVTKYWLPFLLLALFVAVVTEFYSVKSIELESGVRTPGSSRIQNDGQPRLSRSSSQQADTLRKSRLAIGEQYASLKELEEDQQIAGFIRTGYFGKFWPARVSEVATDNDGISFVRQNGTRHNYSKFDGYQMKMIRLRTGNKETIVVFRSESKK